MLPDEAYVARSIVVALGDAGVVRGHDRCCEVVLDDDTVDASTIKPLTSATIRATCDGKTYEIGVVVRRVER